MSYNSEMQSNNEELKAILDEVNALPNAEDLVSPTATVTQTDTGAVIRITDKNGTTEATVTNGKDGYVCVTKAAYSVMTDEQLSQYYTNGVRLVIVEDGYANLVPVSTDANGEVYQGCGYRKHTRLTSSGGFEESQFACVTGFIPYTSGDTIRVVGAEGSIDTFGNYIGFYNASHELIAVYYMSVAVRESGGTYKHWKDGIHIATVPTGAMTGSYATTCSNAAYIRVSFNPCMGRNLIVTANEEIPEV